MLLGMQNGEGGQARVPDPQQPLSHPESGKLSEKGKSTADIPATVGFAHQEQQAMDNAELQVMNGKTTTCGDASVSVAPASGLWEGPPEHVASSTSDVEFKCSAPKETKTQDSRLHKYKCRLLESVMCSEQRQTNARCASADQY